MGEATGTIEAEIASIRADMAHRAEDPHSEMRSTAGRIEDIKREVAAGFEAERRKREASGKAQRARGRCKDDNAVWFWASGDDPSGGDGQWNRYSPHICDVLEGVWAVGDAEVSVYPRPAVLAGEPGEEYVVSFDSFLQTRADDPSLRRKVRRDGAEGAAPPEEDAAVTPEGAAAVAATAAEAAPAAAAATAADVATALGRSASFTSVFEQSSDDEVGEGVPPE